MRVWPLGLEDPLEEGLSTHPSILAWRIPMDRGAWWTKVHRVAKSWTQLKWRSTQEGCYIAYPVLHTWLYYYLLSQSRSSIHTFSPTQHKPKMSVIFKVFMSNFLDFLTPTILWDCSCQMLVAIVCLLLTIVTSNYWVLTLCQAIPKYFIILLHGMFTTNLLHGHHFTDEVTEAQRNGSSWPLCHVATSLPIDLLKFQWV